MMLTRYKRTTAWVLALGIAAAVLGFVKIENRVGGEFEVRSALRVELRAPAAGFLREIYFDQGDYVSPGAPVARLSVGLLKMSGGAHRRWRYEVAVRCLQPLAATAMVLSGSCWRIPDRALLPATQAATVACSPE